MNLVNGHQWGDRILRAMVPIVVAGILFARVSNAAIVEITGSPATSLLNPSLVGASPTNVFYTHKTTMAAINCENQPGSHLTCPLSPYLQAFDEQQNVTLTSSVRTDNAPYQQVAAGHPPLWGWEIDGPTIPAGTVVDSHYIWFNTPTGINGPDVRSFKFDGPVIGIIGNPVHLWQTNGTLGFDVLNAPAGLRMANYTPTGSVDLAYNGAINLADFVSWRKLGGLPGDYFYWRSQFDLTAIPACGNHICFVNEEPPGGDIVMRTAPAVLTLDFNGFAGDEVRIITAANVPLHIGDVDHDYDVDNTDYAIFRETLDSSTDHRADQNNDGKTDLADYVMWRKNTGWSYTFSAPSLDSSSGLDSAGAVPEPGSAAILMTAALLIGLRRRSRACCDGR